MAIKQITIFIENRAGRLLEVTQLLADNKIDLRALNIAETTDYGLLRIIVDDTAKALNVLKENGAIATTTDVLAVAVPNVPGGLNTLLQVLATANVDVSYMY
ncbi:MAG: ACT domain-containing protein, partial [Clostridia bacterium]|nr:ACT domain-containing protein [Clostridia bacterium]